MTAVAVPVAAPAPPRNAWMRRLHVLLGVQSLLLVLASVNRLTSLGDAALLPHGSLRAIELVNLLVLPPLDGQLCEVVRYHDDGLSHLLFFAGFAGIAAVLLIAQAVATGVAAMPLERRPPVLFNASLIAAAIVANLGFEPIGLDLVVVALVAALSLALLRRAGPRPVIVYFAWAYVIGLVATVAVRLA